LQKSISNIYLLQVPQAWSYYVGLGRNQAWVFKVRVATGSGFDS